MEGSQAPAQSRPPAKAAEAKAEGGNGGDAIASELANAREAEEARLAREDAVTAQSHRDAAAAREAYEDSDVGAVARQIAEVEEDIRSEGPSAGSVVGDPTKGPST